MAKKAIKKKRKKPEDLTAEEILSLWKQSARSGLGIGKRFSPDIFRDFDGKFVTQIDEFKKTHVFDKDQQRFTTTVARDLGRICRMFTLGGTVNIDTFQLVFDLSRQHPVCVGGGGGGGWCDIP